MIEIKPCPFCGGKDIRIVDRETFSYLECPDCLIRFYQCEACSVEENIEAWNRRAVSEVNDEQVSEQTGNG